MRERYAVANWVHQPFPGSKHRRRLRLVLLPATKYRPQELVLEELREGPSEWVELFGWYLAYASFNPRAQETYEARRDSYTR